jgi:Ca-activated chloride channel family protein
VTKDAPAKITVALTGTLPAASLKPAQMRVAATGALEVGWTGPNGKDDYIVFARVNGEALETRHYAYVRDGNPVKVRAPGEPGDYELRYVWGAAEAVLARMKITVTPVTAVLDAPANGTAGAEIAVTFSGPNAEEDWVGLATPGSDASSYESGAWRYASNGSSVRLRLPVEPGAYEVRYVSGLDPKVLARKVITVEAASASVTAPARGMAGTSITVGFRGEGADDTFIGVVQKGAGPSAYIGGAYERPQGNEVTLRLPAEPGPYEVRFVLEAHGTYKVLASTPITVEPATASLTAPDRVKRETDIEIGFTGPKGEGDYVTIVAPKAAADAYTDFAYTTPDTSTVSIKAPDEPGAYEVRYVMTAPGEKGPMVIARKAIRVE